MTDDQKQFESKLKELKSVYDNDQHKHAKHAVAKGFGNMSIDLIAGIGLGAFFGYQIDTHFNTLPLFFIILVLMGAVGGFWNFYKNLMKDLKAEGKKDE
jgi:F0F1-type ATP synthase assembly protein I